MLGTKDRVLVLNVRCVGLHALEVAFPDSRLRHDSCGHRPTRALITVDVVKRAADEATYADNEDTADDELRDDMPPRLGAAKTIHGCSIQVFRGFHVPGRRSCMRVLSSPRPRREAGPKTSRP